MYLLICAFFLYKLFKHCVVKWLNLKRRDWHIKFFSVRPRERYTWKDMIDICFFIEILWQLIASIWLFSNKLLIDSCSRISKNVNHISNHGFKYLLGSVISIDTSERVAKFSFASVNIFVSGNTALHIAAQNGLLACVKLLRLAGAPLFLENNDKKTACDLCEKNPYLSEVAQYLESAMVFNYEKDSQKFCIEEINALKCEIFKYEIKGQSKEDYDFGWTSRNNYVSRSSNCNSNSSGSENNEMSTNNGSNDNNTTKTAGTISPEQSERCWIQSSFTRKELVALREAILFSTASALAITEDVSSTICFREKNDRYIKHRFQDCAWNLLRGLCSLWNQLFAV